MFISTILYTGEVKNLQGKVICFKFARSLLMFSKSIKGTKQGNSSEICITRSALAARAPSVTSQDDKRIHTKEISSVLCFEIQISQIFR